MIRDELLGQSLEIYFKFFEKKLEKDVDLEWLTDIFTEVPYTEKKPYLTIRHLIPKDKRFKEIEIIYDVNSKNKVKAIVWNFKVTLRELMHLFGKPNLKYEAYADSMLFTFSSNNCNIDVIKTRLPNPSEKIIGLREDELSNISTTTDGILDLEFIFLQFGLL